VSIASLTAFTVRPIGSSDENRFASGLLLAFVLYAVCVVLLVRIRPVVDRDPLPWVLHALDLAWIAAITLVTGGVDSPFFIVAAFALLTAGYRWGFRETIGTTVLLLALLLGESLFMTDRPRAEALPQVNEVLVRAAYLLIGGALLGSLAERERSVRESASSVARIADQLRPEEGARHALDGALRELLTVFGAKTVLLVALDQSNGRLYRSNAPVPGEEPAVSEAELEPEDELTYLFPMPAVAWSAVRRKNAHGRFDVFGLNPGEGRPRRAVVDLPDRFLSAHPFHSLLVAPAAGADRAHRLLLLDARAGARELRTLRTIAEQVGPAIYSVERLARLRSRVSAAERARVARDLHDGVIQSLIGLEMKVDVWRRQAGSADSSTASKLEHIQNALRTEVIELRDLIVRMKTVSVDPKHVLEHLAALVERFQRDSGIAAHFVSEIDEINLSPHVCDEVVRIVQEALVNVRKHSGARTVLVRVSAARGYWKFEVDDDGRGFEFAGRRSQAELDVERKGPVIIKERVRAIGGQLAVESDPGHGARVEVQLSQRTHG
jgi:signal transduction histidine kinase